MIEVTYLGNASFIIRSETTTLLLDPYISGNSECPFTVQGLIDEYGETGIDAICVTHIADDHFGDTLELAKEYEIPVISEPGVCYFLEQNGVSTDNITKLAWGLEAVVNDLTVRSLEAKHVSSTIVDGELITGCPMGFLITNTADNNSVYHLGDTSIFSDLKLFGELYEPTIALIGVGQPYSEYDEAAPVYRIVHELTADEAVRVANWINSEYTIPMHYLPGEKADFVRAWETAGGSSNLVSLDFGDSFEIE